MRSGFTDHKDTQTSCGLFARHSQVELCGRSINVGRPKGYMDPALLGGMATPAVQMPGMGIQMPGMGLSTPNMFPNMPNKQMPGMGMQMPGMGMQMPGMGMAGGGVNQQQMLLGMVR
jgi:hypothetical protein